MEGVIRHLLHSCQTDYGRIGIHDGHYEHMSCFVEGCSLRCRAQTIPVAAMNQSLVPR